MKKIGIVTLYYKTYNYGAQLQAYALQKAVESLGYECEQISFVWSKLETIQIYQSVSIDVEKFEKFSYAIPHSKKVYTPLTIAESVNEYDGFICGSDQIWGVNENMPKYVLPLITLSFVPEHKLKIAYGASMGSGAIDQERLYAFINALKRLDGISVREKEAINFLTNYTEKEIIQVIDPVMLLSKNEWDKIAHISNENKEYIFIYYVNINREILDIANELALKNNCKVVSLAYFEGEKVGPEDFVGLIRNAKYVITDSFHATVFSILYEKKFISMGADQLTSNFSKNTRTKNLLEIFHLGDRFFLSRSETIISTLEKDINYEKVTKKLSTLRVGGYNFLTTQLLKEPKNASKNSIKYANKIANKYECTGCEACISVCANGSIKVIKDTLGFSYPSIDENMCVECGMCTIVCPIINPIVINKKKEIKICLSAQSRNDEVLKNSSSGGVFYEFAKAILQHGGIVFGSVYDKCNKVKHKYCQTIEELDAFCRSKYVQSEIADNYIKAKHFLENGRLVLFVGAPCQIAGFKSYLNKEYENLYLIDFICGGVTAPKLWEKYLEYHKAFGHLKSISMRNKTRGYLNNQGYPNFSMELINDQNQRKVISREEDYFFNSRFGFYRESCFECKFKGVAHTSDITMGDFCGINTVLQQKDDGKGTSLVILQSEKGEKLFKANQKAFHVKEYAIEIALQVNPMLSESMKKPFYYDYVRDTLEFSTIEKMNYEIKYFDEFFKLEQIKRDFWYDIIRNGLFFKLLKFQSFELSIEDIPSIKENVIIYGAGKIGLLLLQILKKDPICFIDASEDLHNCQGIEVFRLDDRILKRKIYKEEQISIIVTPVWDFMEITEKIRELYPSIHIISVEDIVKVF